MFFVVRTELHQSGQSGDQPCMESIPQSVRGPCPTIEEVPCARQARACQSGLPKIEDCMEHDLGGVCSRGVAK
eukprot:scaffold2194_cov130-Cylindrotheca_fusiformis.AAC.7